jgi:hypothetical protein
VAARVAELRDSAIVFALVASTDDFIGRATLVLAGATVLLAGFTAYAAHWTKKAARATEGIVDGSIRPWITAHPDDTLRVEPFLGELRSTGSVTLKIWNVGEGLALIAPGRTYMREYHPDQAQPERLHPGIVAEPAIPPIGEILPNHPRGGASLVYFNLKGRHVDGPTLTDLLAEEPPAEDVRFLIDLEYTDAAGGQPIWARFHCLRPADRNSATTVTRIDYLRDKHGRPVVPAWMSTESQLG